MIPMADNLLVAAAQLSAKLESVSGTAETLTAAEVDLKPDIAGFNFTPQIDMVENRPVSDDLGAGVAYPSGFKGSIAFSVGLKCGGVVGTDPAISRYLKACGFKFQTVLTTSCGAPSPGSFAAGDTYSATGGKTGIIEQAYTGAGTLRYIVTAGGALANNDVVTCGANSATCTATQATYAVKASPRSSAFETITIQRGVKNYDGTSAKDYLCKLRGAMGTGTIQADANGFLKFSGEFQGVISSLGDGSLFTGCTYEATLPPKFQNATFQIGGVTLIPDSVSIDLGNEVVLDPDPTTGGGTSGYLKARITQRNPKITVAPLRVPTTTFDDLGKLQSGATVAFQMILGTTPNLIEIKAPICQIRDLTLGERSGLETSSMTLACLTDDALPDNDLAIYFR